MKYRPYILIGGVILVITILLYRGWLHPIQGTTLNTSGPIARVGANIVQTIGGVTRSFFQIGSLSRNLRIQEEEVATLRARIAKLSGVENENNILRRELELLPRETYDLLSADVIGRPIDGLREILFINRGTIDGLTEGMPVIAHGGVVIGKIIEVTPNTASVLLITDPSSQIAAQIKESNNAQGVVRGLRGLDVVMESVSRTAKISIGASVVTTGADGVFPSDLLIGIVRSTDTSDLEIFQTIRIIPEADFRQLKIVSVILQ